MIVTTALVVDGLGQEKAFTDTVCRDVANPFAVTSLIAFTVSSFLADRLSRVGRHVTKERQPQFLAGPEPKRPVIPSTSCGMSSKETSKKPCARCSGFPPEQRLHAFFDRAVFNGAGGRSHGRSCSTRWSLTSNRRPLDRSTFLPLRRMIVRSAISRTSCNLWLTKIVEIPLLFQIADHFEQRRYLFVRPTPLLGSSMMIRRAFARIAFAWQSTVGRRWRACRHLHPGEW